MTRTALLLDSHARPRAIASSTGAAALLFGVLLSTSSVAEAAPAAPGSLRWLKTAGDPMSDTQASSIATDLAGNVVVTGSFTDSADFGGGELFAEGGHDVVVAKLDRNGHHLWSKRFGNEADHQGGNSITTDLEGNVYITGNFQGEIDFGGGPLVATTDVDPDPVGDTTGIDVFLVKLDRNGNHVFSRRFGGQGWQLGQGVAVDLFGNAYIVGAFEGEIDFGGGPRSCVGECTPSGGRFNGFLAKFDRHGNYVFDRTLESGPDGQNAISAIAVDLVGTTYVTGYFSGELDAAGPALTGVGYNDVFLAKYDPWGNPVWSQAFAVEPGYNLPTGLAVDLHGDAVLYGTFNSTVNFGGDDLTPSPGMFGDSNDDLFLAKFGPSGNHLWSKSFGDGGIQSSASLAVDLQGNIGITGGIGGSVDFGGGPLEGGFFLPHAFVAKLDGNGNHVYSEVASGAVPAEPFSFDFSLASDAAFDLAGNLNVCGAFNGNFTLGAQSYSTDPDAFNTFIARFAR